jgi:hypothetical protein
MDLQYQSQKVTCTKDVYLESRLMLKRAQSARGTERSFILLPAAFVLIERIWKVSLMCSKKSFQCSAVPKSILKVPINFAF